MANLKRFFLFTLIRAVMRLFSWRQDFFECSRQIRYLVQELNRSRSGACTRDELETRHTRIVAGLLGQLRIGAEAHLMLAREVVAKNGELEVLGAEIRKLREAAMIEPLTGLYNRRGASEALRRLLSVFERQNQRAVNEGNQIEIHDLSVLALDLNHFKEVNDRFGHGAGDGVLTIIAEHLKQAFRAEDVLVRQGGDEFMVYLVNATRAGAIIRAEKLSTLMLADDRLQFDDVRVTVSIGISHGCFATKRGGLQIVETLEQLADTAMYAAKEESRQVSGITVAPDAISSDTILGNL